MGDVLGRGYVLPCVLEPRDSGLGCRLPCRALAACLTACPAVVGAVANQGAEAPPAPIEQLGNRHRPDQRAVTHAVALLSYRRRSCRHPAAQPHGEQCAQAIRDSVPVLLALLPN